ncbi:MAG TPA: hypothetical protein DEP05_07235 [Betaproteobacteria bacterium]|nr:hypothetical protein [Betaproteobacteria bacterium]
MRSPCNASETTKIIPQTISNNYIFQSKKNVYKILFNNKDYYFYISMYSSKLIFCFYFDC